MNIEVYFMLTPCQFDSQPSHAKIMKVTTGTIEQLADKGRIRVGGRGCADTTFLIQMVAIVEVLDELYSCLQEGCPEGHCGL